MLHDGGYSGDFIVAIKAVVGAGKKRAAAGDYPDLDHLPWPFVTW